MLQLSEGDEDDDRPIGAIEAQETKRPSRFFSPKPTAWNLWFCEIFRYWSCVSAK
jgi:hypothetical protein